MCLSLFYAKLVGLYCVLFSLAVLLNHHRFKKIFNDFLSNHALVAFSGIVMTVFGLILVISHNLWVADWPVLITLFGWFILLQGVCRLFITEFFIKNAREFLSKMGFTVLLWVLLFAGAYLTWFGFTQI